MGSELKCYINGAWVNANSGATMSVLNPSTGETVGVVPDCNAEDTSRAVAAAAEAFSTWSKTTGRARRDALVRLYNLVMANKESLAETIVKENGKPFKEALGEIDYGASYILWYAEEAQRIYGETIPALAENKRIIVIKQPIGVVGAITPWNYPLAMVTRKISAALATGCTIVLKPAEDTPLTALMFGQLMEQAELPRGVANIVTGQPDDIGKELMTNPLVRKITFTGSTDVGKLLMRGAAEHVQKISLELGGHAPFIVFDDADVDLAVEGAVVAKFKNAGQACVCGNRYYVHRQVYADFVSKLKKRVGMFRVGDGFDSTTDIGPLINREAVNKVERHVTDAVEHGAQLVMGGQRITCAPLQHGHFYEPTILDQVTPQMLISREETFGPILPLTAFDEEDEVIELANNTPYGLTAYFYTTNLSRAISVSERLEYGVVGINDSGPAVAYSAPFGGMKQSGLGREGGRQGLEEFLETKYLSIQL